MATILLAINNSNFLCLNYPSLICLCLKPGQERVTSIEHYFGSCRIIPSLELSVCMMSLPRKHLLEVCFMSILRIL